MRIKLLALSAIILLVFLTNSCTQDKGTDDSSNYIRARINGQSWQTNNVSVQMTSVGTATIPLSISGTANNQLLNIMFASLNPGSYPFREHDINPATLLSFTAEYFESGHRIKWSTAAELNVATFSVESSNDAITFIQVATANPTGSNSNYQLVPSNDPPAGVNVYYRLKIINTDGSFAFSNTVVMGPGYTVAFRPDVGAVVKRGYDGVLEITSHDMSSRVITGHFNCKIKTSGGVLYTITNGEFRFKY